MYLNCINRGKDNWGGGADSRCQIAVPACQYKIWGTCALNLVQPPLSALCFII